MWHSLGVSSGLCGYGLEICSHNFDLITSETSKDGIILLAERAFLVTDNGVLRVLLLALESCASLADTLIGFLAGQLCR